MDFAVNIESKFSPMLLRKLNTWYSVNDGNWSDPNTWMSNGLDKRSYTSPQPGDIVYINRAVTCNVNSTVSNLYVSGNLQFSASVNPVLTVINNLQATGTIDQSAGSSRISIGGVSNFIVSF